MDPVRQQFARRRLRCTQQRLAVYRALCETTAHPTADELYQMVCASGCRISRATVYNTLEVLFDAGLCRRIPTTSGTVCYDADMSDHLHVRCRRSGRVRDVPPHLGRRFLDNLPASVIAEIEERMDIRIDGVQVQFYGETGWGGSDGNSKVANPREVGSDNSRSFELR